MKTKVQKQAEHWASMFNQFSAETGGFTADLSTLTDYELISLKWANRSFLDFGPQMIGIAMPQYRAKLRREIAYLADLAERQSVALEKCGAIWQKRGVDIRDVNRQLYGQELTNNEKITLVKSYFGWE